MTETERAIRALELLRDKKIGLRNAHREKTLPVAIEALREKQQRESIHTGGDTQGVEDAGPLVGWIAVEDRLPEELTVVLVSSSHSQFPQVSMAFCEEGLWIDGMPGSGLKFMQQELVTHWMPLPEPPRSKCAERRAET